MALSRFTVPFLPRPLYNYLDDRIWSLLSSSMGVHAECPHIHYPVARTRNSWVSGAKRILPRHEITDWRYLDE
jgi:hypothetical protein